MGKKAEREEKMATAIFLAKLLLEEEVAQVLLSDFLSAPQGESAPPCAVCERLQRRNNGAVPIERSLLGCAIEATICHIQKYIPTAATL